MICKPISQLLLLVNGTASPEIGFVCKMNSLLVQAPTLPVGEKLESAHQNGFYKNQNGSPIAWTNFG